MTKRFEPPLRGPWPVWALSGVILASYAVQSRLLDLDSAATRYGLVGANLWRGQWHGLITALFVHGGWAHAGMNAAGALAFGAPAARMFGGGAGVAGFFLFYLMCGALSGLGYAAVHPHSVMPLVGASGAVSGLFGAASRLFDRSGRLAPIISRTVISSAGAWIAVNVMFGLAGIAPGMGDANIAWEAHIAGYFAGLFLIGPSLRLFNRQDPGASEDWPP